MAIDTSKPWEEYETAEPTGPDRLDRPDHDDDPDVEDDDAFVSPEED